MQKSCRPDGFLRFRLCQPCISLDRDILKKKSFIEEASKKYILFNADYPINTRLGQELQAQNKSLAANTAFTASRPSS